MSRMKAWVIVAALVAGSRAEAQQYFGQNQVQYRQFDWKILETDHFLVHYYPEERVAAMDAARMAERSYAKLSRMLNHQFREKKPLILYASRGDFGENNVTGDLGEGTGGVTEALRHRMLLPFTGDLKTFEHVLAHEMTHAFQYDIFARGRAGNGLQTLAQVDPPLWFAEGMAEYLSLGPNHILTQTWVRDAALNGNLPSIEQMTEQPERYFPYRYGEALWEYIGGRWGDEVIGEIMNSVPNVGVERAFKRELGLSLEDLSDEWREAMQTKHLPQVADRDRARKFAQPLLTQRKSGGFASFFVAPAFSPDAKHIAFIGYGSFLRGEVFTDLWLADGETGKRLKRLVKTESNPNAEELRQLYSQVSFSPDGKLLAYTAMTHGRDVLYLLDVKRRKTIRKYELPLDGVTSPSWSPDGRRLVFSCSNGGVTDLCMVDVDGRNYRRLTDDKHGDVQPQWSPDGKKIAFASDRGPNTDFDQLHFDKWQVSILDLETNKIDVIPGQAGLNLNPNWSPDGKSFAYISDRTGIPNLFLYDLDKRQHFQLTNVMGGVLAVTEFSPAITWARQADRLAFTYYENGELNVWSVNNPRHLAKEPFKEPAPVVAQKTRTDSGATQTKRTAAQAAAQTPATPTPGNVATPGAPVPTPPGATPATPATQPGATPSGVGETDSRTSSVYRTPVGIRASADLPAVTERETQGAISVARLLDSTAITLPDTTKFRKYAYHIGFQPEYISRPSIGYAQDNFGRGVFGGTTIVLSDLLGNNRLAFAGQVNGRIDEAYFFAGYTSLGHRLQYTTGLSQQPIFFYAGGFNTPLDSVGARYWETQVIARYVVRQAFLTGLYPLNRYSRFEYGAEFNNIAVSLAYVGRGVDYVQQFATEFVVDSITNSKSLNYAAPYVAYVSDNTLYGYTGPISGRRYRFQVQPTVGNLRWIDYVADYRHYYPILFNFLTFATRFQSSISAGRDEETFRKYIGRPDFIRGYDREQLASADCNIATTTPGSCSASQLVGSRVAFANAELRFPLVRRFDLGLLPISLPPVDGLVFYDAGIAWTRNQSITWSRPEAYDEAKNRYVLRSYGMGIRLNLFGFALLRWDYAIPLDSGLKKGYWVWTLGPSF
jgi:WD40 repeat protein